MSALSAADRVMDLAQHGQVEPALAAAETALLDDSSDDAEAQAALWYAIARAELVRGSMPGVLTAAERCLSLAAEADSPGWSSAGLSVRAIAMARQGRMEPALLDLGRSEADLAGCDDPDQRRRAHTSLGSTYLELRLYEMAQPHFEQALVVDGGPWVTDWTHLVDLHIRWADEIERVHPDEESDAEVTWHRSEAHRFAEQALQHALRERDKSAIEICRSMELCSRPRDDAPASLAQLREAFAVESTDDPHGYHVMVGGALARALWACGRRKEALEVARRSVSFAVASDDWQIAASSQWLLVEMEAQTGVAGAASGRAYAGLLSTVLWQQRLSTLQGAQAALQLERLHRDKEQAQQAAREDALTGVGNRRMLDDVLRALKADGDGTALSGERSMAMPLSMLVVDLNEFKKINDTYGHVVGDEVLRAVAMAIKGVARSDDIVARVGGDEFVVLAQHADSSAGRRLAERIAASVDSLTVGSREGLISLSASVGVATATTASAAASLLGEADEAMYAVKADWRSSPGVVPTPRRPRG